MIRKYNYTDRKKIRADKLKVRLMNIRGKPYFDAEVDDLDDVRKPVLPPDAKLVIEAFDRGSFQRFDWGTVEFPLPPKSEDRRLAEIQEIETINFRLRVIDESEEIGKILASTKDIRVWAEEIEDTRKASLLPLIMRNIGDSIWQMNFEVPDDKNPELLVNEKFNEVNIREMLLTNPYFTTLIYPLVLNTILSRVLFHHNIRDTDGDGWEHRWLTLTLELPGVESIPEEGNPTRDQDWINNSVSMFCRQHSMLDRLLKQVGTD